MRSEDESYASRVETALSMNSHVEMHNIYVCLAEPHLGTRGGTELCA